MNIIKCNRCGKDTIELSYGSSVVTGTITICKHCYDKHVQKHNVKKNTKTKTSI